MAAFMDIEVRRGGQECLEQYGEVPIRFRVESVFRVVEADGGPGGLLLREEKLAKPYEKDYDSYEEGGPVRWRPRFDVSGWGIFMAFADGRHVGGAVVAVGPEIDNIPKGWAKLFDIRVHPDLRRRGIGTALFEPAVAWCREHGIAMLEIETQNVNVQACRFYAGRGCRLGTIDRYGYAGHPQVGHEAALYWYIEP